MRPSGLDFASYAVERANLHGWSTWEVMPTPRSESAIALVVLFDMRCDGTCDGLFRAEVMQFVKYFRMTGKVEEAVEIERQGAI